MIIRRRPGIPVGDLPRATEAGSATVEAIGARVRVVLSSVVIFSISVDTEVGVSSESVVVHLVGFAPKDLPRVQRSVADADTRVEVVVSTVQDAHMELWEHLAPSKEGSSSRADEYYELLGELDFPDWFIEAGRSKTDFREPHER